jgi:GNAT superfamily N-acetyltransferase
MTLKVVQEAQPDTATIKTLEDGLVAYNMSMAGGSNNQPLYLVGRDDAGNIQAGLKGRSFYNWMLVEWLWVAEAFRKKNYGSTLLSQAEQIARERGCIGVLLDTFSFQAPEFYARHAYKEFGRVNNFPMGHARIYLSKTF